MSGPGFVVIEFATTGLLAGVRDRVTEVTFVHLSAEGRIEGQWSTRISAGKVDEAQRFRRLPSESAPAPTFASIAHRAVSLLAGRVVVAHEAAYQLRFLADELQRASLAMPENPVVLCTMQLARDFLPGATRSRENCRAAYGLAHRYASTLTPRTTAEKAVATAELLTAFIGSNDDRSFWEPYLSEALDVFWPLDEDNDVTAEWKPQPSEPRAVTGEQHHWNQQGYLDYLVRNLPAYLGPTEHLDYLAVLDRCLREVHLETQEDRALVRLSEQLNISRFACETLHYDYFRELCHVARTLRELDGEQREWLWGAGDLLDLPTSVIRAALDEPWPQGESELLAG